MEKRKRVQVGISATIKTNTFITELVDLFSFVNTVKSNLFPTIGFGQNLLDSVVKWLASGGLKLKSQRIGGGDQNSVVAPRGSACRTPRTYHILVSWARQKFIFAPKKTYQFSKLVMSSDILFLLLTPQKESE